ncbi:Thioredoxin X [Picochlorum sp. SENEW3]|nr:Thioredoxin X [Picochlorum sp. SENEW3]
MVSSVGIRARVDSSLRTRPSPLPHQTWRPHTTRIHRHTIQTHAVTDVTEASFQSDVIEASSSVPVLVDFWATWCGPCKLVAPSMVWADSEFEGKLKVVKVDCTDENKGLMEEYKVYGLPCLIVIKDGTVVDGSHHEGAITKKGLAEYIAKNTGLQASSV